MREFAISKIYMDPQNYFPCMWTHFCARMPAPSRKTYQEPARAAWLA